MSTSALELAPEPRSVKEARAWVVDALHDLGREDLTDAAELGVSELVTNAILHATPPIVLRLGGTPTHPRVEVHDSSAAPPVIRDMTGEERLLAAVGRGLGIVATFSTTWGAEVSAHGKLVWFEPAAEPSADPEEALERNGDVFDLSLVVQHRLAEAGPPGDRYTVALKGMPVKLFDRHRLWYEEVRRELRLLALNHGQDYPIATELSELTLQVEQERHLATGTDTLDQAIAAGMERVDLEYEVPTSAAETMTRLRELLVHVDDFCREQRLLTLSPTPQMLALRDWYLGEFGRQARGEAATPWSGGYVER